MRLCLVIKNDYRDCPPLHRLLMRLSQNGYPADVYCIGNMNSSLENKLDFGLGEVNIIAVPRASGITAHFRPLVEIPRLNKAISSTDNEYNICIAFDPYALEAVRQSRIAVIVPIIYYSLEIWDEPRFWPQRICEKLGRNIISGLVCPQVDRINFLKDTLNYSGPSLEFPNITFDYIEEQHIGDRNSPIRPPTVFVYLGGLQLRKRAVLELIEVFGNRVEDAHLVIYGRATSKDNKRIMAILETVKWPQNISINEFLPYGEHFSEANKWHVGVMLYVNVSLNYRYCAPNKIYEYSMLSLPILASNQPHLVHDIEGSKFGLCVNPESVDDIENAVRRLCKHENIDELGRNARYWYLARDYDSYFQEFLDFCGTLID